MRLLSRTTSLTPSDYIKKTIGNILFVYYMYLKYYQARPKDLEDLVDGLLYISASNFQEKKQLEDWKAQHESQRK